MVVLEDEAPAAAAADARALLEKKLEEFAMMNRVVRISWRRGGCSIDYYVAAKVILVLSKVEIVINAIQFIKLYSCTANC